jgi:micrococcal nuclease
MEITLYHYNAKVTKVYDGDTITVDIDLGLSTWVRGEKIRLARINAPEVRGEQRPQGLVAAEFLRNLLIDQEVIIQTIKDKKGKYGRYIGDVWLQQGEQWTNASDLMVQNGYAQYAEY